MDKVRRVERMVAMTKLLVDSPQKLIPLNYFCDFFGMAKSTVSEDLTCVRQSMEHFQLGTLEWSQIASFQVVLFICLISCMTGM